MRARTLRKSPPCDFVFMWLQPEVFEGGGEAIFVTAQDIFQGGFNRQLVGIRSGTFWAARTVNDIDDRPAELPSCCRKLGTIALREFLGVGQCLPDLRFLFREGRLK